MYSLLAMDAGTSPPQPREAYATASPANKAECTTLQKKQEVQVLLGRAKVAETTKLEY
jgi:hypothetical protein